jgi:hypothetical protein
MRVKANVIMHANFSFHLTHLRYVQTNNVMELKAVSQRKTARRSLCVLVYSRLSLVLAHDLQSSLFRAQNKLISFLRFKSILQRAKNN